jgi:NADH-ubiquinone oxidoreductase chain 5
MRYDSQLLRFLSFLSLFTFCMLILVNSTNLIHLFFGWEGVGLCSYLLINFWFTRIQANKAAIKAMLMNRIGDISLLIFIAYIYYIYRTFDYSLILMLNASYKYAYINFYYISIHLNSLLVFFLFIAVMGKSAQLGLHTWLPDAMEGPTPVSALIHAATMVTAGVFILIKYYFFLEYSLLHFCIFIIGSLTALFGAIIAIFQNDIKKIIAYSTCSQLGYMIVSCGLGFYNLALFHLFNHAFFKALLFLSAGVILHALSDEQDMRKMGGLVNFLPFTYCCFFFASYALMGLPFLSGFYSKDIILEVSFYSFNIYSLLSFYFLLITAFCTAFYSIKLIYFVFFKKPKGFFISYKVIKDADIIIIFVFLILFFISLFSGFIFFDFFMGLDKEFLLFNVISKTYNNFIEYEFNFYLYKLFPFIFSVLGIICGLYFYYFINNKFTINILNINIYKNIYDFFVNKWFFDLLYNRFFIDNIFKFSYNVTYKLIDKNLLEIFGVNLIYYFVYKISFFFKNYFSTYLYIYLFLFFNGFIILIFLIFQPLYLYIFIFIYIYLICYYLFYLK